MPSCLDTSFQAVISATAPSLNIATQLKAKGQADKGTRCNHVTCNSEKTDTRGTQMEHTRVIEAFLFFLKIASINYWGSWMYTGLTRCLQLSRFLTVARRCSQNKMSHWRIWILGMRVMDSVNKVEHALQAAGSCTLDACSDPLFAR